MKTKQLSIIVVIAALLISCGTSRDANKSLKDNISRKEILKDDLQKKAIKQARNDAKAYKKDGFRIFLGGLPLEKQIESAWIKAVDSNEDGLPKYIVANSRVIGSNTSAAKAQALHLAKVEMAGLISSNVAALIESSTANNELSQQEAVSLSKALQASKELITADLGRVLKEVEVYRELPNRNVEVMVCLSYSSDFALEATKKNMVKSLEDKTDVLHKKLDKMLDLEKFNPGNNTNLKMDIE